MAPLQLPPKSLSGMLRLGASLAIPHRKSFAAILSVSRVHLGHTNRNVLLSHKLQREIALVKALSRPIPDNQPTKMGLCFAGFVLLMFCGPFASHDSNPYPNCSRIARYNATIMLRMASHCAKRAYPILHCAEVCCNRPMTRGGSPRCTSKS